MLTWGKQSGNKVVSFRKKVTVFLSICIIKKDLQGGYFKKRFIDSYGRYCYFFVLTMACALYRIHGEILTIHLNSNIKHICVTIQIFRRFDKNIQCFHFTFEDL